MFTLFGTVSVRLIVVPRMDGYFDLLALTRRLTGSPFLLQRKRETEKEKKKRSTLKIFRRST